MKTLYYSQIDDPSIEEIIGDIKENNPNKIILFCETEWEYQPLLELVDVINKNNIELLITFCSFPNEWYTRRTKYFNNIKLIHWPTYWVHWTMMCSNNLNFNLNYENFKYSFICLNNKNHIHRCLLIDELTRNNLLDLGIVTWHRFPNQNKSPYEFKYYNDDIKLINDDFETKLDSFLIPPQYHESFLHVIAEATIKVTCISEKTWLPILYKKPWIVLADQYFHKKIIDLGFELYDEIIDYSFDNEPDLQKRAYMISENVKTISKQNINNLYKTIKPKLDKNYKNYMRILHDRSYVPDVIKERVALINAEKNIKPIYTDPRYIFICNQVGIL